MTDPPKAGRTRSKGFEVLKSLRKGLDGMGKKLLDASYAVMYRCGRESQDPIDIIVAALEGGPLARLVEAEMRGITVQEALSEARRVEDRPGFKGNGVAVSFTPAMVTMLETLDDTREAYFIEAASRVGTNPGLEWSWTRQLVLCALASDSSAVVELRARRGR